MPPLSGIVDLYGPEISMAGRIAVAQINEAGGVLGCRIELIIEDDGSMPETAVAAANRLIEHHRCHAIIGNLLSNSRIAVASMVAEPRHVPYLNFSFYEGSISGRYFFHFAALPNQQIEKMIPYMAGRFGPKMFFAGNNYEWPRGSIDAAKDSLLLYGGEVVGESYLPIGTTPEQIESLLDSVAKSGADVFVPYFAGADQIALLNRFAEYGLKRKMAVVMGHYDEAMVRFLAPEVRENLYSSNTYFMEVPTACSEAYKRRLALQEGISGLWPEGNGVLTNFGEGVYTCVHAFAKALEAAGSTDPEALVNALEQVSVESAQGTVVMDARTHHAHVNAYLARCRLDGSFEIVESFGLIAPEIPRRYRQEYRAKADGHTPLMMYDLPASGSSSTLGGIFQKIFDVADVAVIATDEAGVILQSNLGASEMLGYGSEELCGMSVHMLVPPNFRSRHIAALERFAKGDLMELRMGNRGEITGYRKDGTLFPAEASISKFQNEGRWILVATLRDITAKKNAEEELTWRATHDPLTRLPNRALLKERLIHALERSKRSRQYVAVLFIDLDHFKLVNDTYGHEEGDRLLIRVAETLVNQVRPGDTVGRLGGDEFIVLCENITAQKHVEVLAERINDAMRFPYTILDREVVCTASIGLALGLGESQSADEILRNADAAMYLSKEQGRDSWKLFSDELTQKVRQRFEIVNGLRHAIERQEFTIVYQPIVATNSGRIMGAESLLRWQYNNNAVSPALFIPIAEQTGTIIPIGIWVFEQVCLMQVKLRERYGEHPPYLSVNLSTVQLNDEGIVGVFEQILRVTGADPAHLLLELTETSLFSDVEKNLRVLRALAALGMRVAVDDFGTGYSSLLQLLRLPVDTIKIDREFIDGLDKRADARLITSAMIKMAKALEKKLIAEGVENEAQHFELQALQCDYIQGYYFYRPMSEEAFLLALEANHDTSRISASKVYYVIYVSEAATSMDSEALGQILSVSRQKNKQKGVTGFLIYQRGYFLQMLEGREEVVSALMERLAADSRHKDVKVVIRGQRSRRLFNDWSMGFWDMSAPLENEADFLAWQKRTINLIEASQDARFCYAFFEALGKSI
ncbi:EAL domain-containing protein [Myxococcota bacterium]|nr:EAL domain-containing protein [Myxococcota bacterium]MBU1900554.1 EAL domain-containing protein [Myxococcota bacterium]